MSRIWTRVTNPISYDDNLYTKLVASVDYITD